MGDVQEVQKLQSWQERVKASVAAGQSARSVPPARIWQDVRVAPYGPVDLPFGQSPVCCHTGTLAQTVTLCRMDNPLWILLHAAVNPVPRHFHPVAVISDAAGKSPHGVLYQRPGRSVVDARREARHGPASDFSQMPLPPIRHAHIRIGFLFWDMGGHCRVGQCVASASCSPLMR